MKKTEIIMVGLAAIGLEKIVAAVYDDICHDLKYTLNRRYYRDYSGYNRTYYNSYLNNYKGGYRDAGGEDKDS